MKKIILCFFDKWWIPVLFCIFTTILFGISIFARNAIFENISLVLFGFALLFLLISAISQVTKPKWWNHSERTF